MKYNIIFIVDDVGTHLYRNRFLSYSYESLSCTITCNVNTNTSVTCCNVYNLLQVRVVIQLHLVLLSLRIPMLLSI